MASPMPSPPPPAALGSTPRSPAPWTSPRDNLGQGFEGTRKVVDISGDGVNNPGRPVADAREEALAQGIVLNGLAVLDKQPGPFAQTAGMPPLDTYYREEVIGGPGAFLVVAEGFPAFEAAVRRKIIREIAAVPAPGARVERFA
ncbi:DUF1194 domain-containing protein [Dankookia sp. P2]|uniref:DUF1194 domain-containing protein n=1 Tax=Dankookia sp. P2 TaxID=3423955 RepID=UPI003D66A804